MLPDDRDFRIAKMEETIEKLRETVRINNERWAQLYLVLTKRCTVQVHGETADDIEAGKAARDTEPGA